MRMVGKKRWTAAAASADHDADHWVCKNSFAKSADYEDDGYGAVNDADVVAPLLASSPSTDTTTKDGPSFVLVVVGLLGVAMMALKVALQRRHRGLLRRQRGGCYSHRGLIDREPCSTIRST